MDLSEAKVGDKIIICNSRIETVLRLTRTLVITKERRYKKSDGYSPGEWYRGAPYARLPTNDSEITELEEANRVAVMLGRIREYDFGKLPQSAIEAIIGIINTEGAE